MRRLGAGLLAAGLTASAAVLLPHLLRSARWRRTNYRGREVNLLGGIATGLGALAVGAGLGGAPGAAATVATSTAGLIGALDDADTSAAAKGFRGHLRALARGEVTTGAVKLFGIAAAGQVAAALGTGAGSRGQDARPVGTRLVDVATSGMLIAGTANLINLFDLRPGRGLKVSAALAVPVAAGCTPGAPLATGALAVVAASWDGELGERTMLGDAGANSMGALVGTALALHSSARVRAGALAAVLVLTAISEKVSFSRVIEATPMLRAVDDWGRLE